jgi:hypothetical protein
MNAWLRLEVLRAKGFRRLRLRPAAGQEAADAADAADAAEAGCLESGCQCASAACQVAAASGCG